MLRDRTALDHRGPHGIRANAMKTADKQHGSTPVPLLVDTDIGDNIDDSFALALAARCTATRLIGVTTVYGDTTTRARLAAGVLELCGLDCPITPGCAVPLLEPTAKVEQPPLLADCLPQGNFRPLGASAVELWSAATEGGAMQAALLCIGPLTNLALALRCRPDLFRMLQILIMAGSLACPVAETNVRLDPEAAYIVVHANVPVTVVPLDVTQRCAFEQATIDRLAQHDDPLLRQLGRGSRQFLIRKDRAQVVPHDAVALTALLHPEWFAFEQGWLEVLLHPPSERGRVVFRPGRSGPVTVAVDVDRAAVLDYMLQAIGVKP